MFTMRKQLKVVNSNGIRFSISDLSPPTARILPTLLQDRAGISLYDAQYRYISPTILNPVVMTSYSPKTCRNGTKAPIPDEVIADVLSAIKRFQRTCEDFGVPTSNINVLATEATREAINSVSFRQQIHDATGWTVEMLLKEEEGRVGAMGVASSARTVQGLIMDLGGGSVQLTWMSEEDGAVTIAPGASVSLPYGAAALLRRLQEAEAQGPGAVDALASEVRANISAAWTQVRPSNLGAHQSFPLFLSGGGFRGWGNVLLDSHRVQPYPIPIINGFTVSASSFRETSKIQANVEAKGSSIFRVSDRRAGQIPAVAFLVTQLTAALPPVSTVRFAQGGVREGFLFTGLPASVRAQIPLDVATLAHAPPSADRLTSHLLSSLPTDPKQGPKCPSLLTSLARPLAHLLYAASPIPKEGRAASSLRLTTTGLLAGVHGLSHAERAALALTLCERWGGEKDLSPTDVDFYARLQATLTPEQAWWTRYLGRVAALLGYLYPAGVVRGSDGLVLGVTTAGGKVALVARKVGGEVVKEGGFEEAMLKVMKVGKKKNWIGGKVGWGLQVAVYSVDGTGRNREYVD